MHTKPGSTNPAGNEPAPTRPPPLSLHELTDRCMGDAALASLVLEKFEAQLNADLREIQQRLADGDAAQIARTAHALKGAAGAAAAPVLRDIAARVEMLAREVGLTGIAEELSSLRAEVDRCLEYLPRARATLKSGPPPGPAR